jgi:hypothetical protein
VKQENRQRGKSPQGIQTDRSAAIHFFTIARQNSRA